MSLEPLLLDGLLRRHVARGEQHRRRDGLRQQRPRRQLALVPTSFFKYSSKISIPRFSRLALFDSFCL